MLMSPDCNPIAIRCPIHVFRLLYDLLFLFNLYDYHHVHGDEVGKWECHMINFRVKVSVS